MNPLLLIALGIVALVLSRRSADAAPAQTVTITTPNPSEALLSALAPMFASLKPASALEPEPEPALAPADPVPSFKPSVAPPPALGPQTAKKTVRDDAIPYNQ